MTTITAVMVNLVRNRLSKVITQGIRTYRPFGKSSYLRLGLNNGR